MLQLGYKDKLKGIIRSSEKRLAVMPKSYELIKQFVGLPLRFLLKRGF